MSTQNRNAGFIIAVLGGLVGLIAFFAMPFLSAFNFISVTAQQLVSLEQQYFSSSSNNGQALIILWLAPVLSGIAILLAALQFRSAAQASSKRAAGGWLIALGILGVALYIGILVYLNSLINTSSSSSTTPSLFSLLGAGYWVYILSMAGVIVGGAMGLSAAKSAPTVMAVPPPSYPSYGQPPTQYPPNQQPWSQPPEYPPPPNQPGSSQWPPSQPH